MTVSNLIVLFTSVMQGMEKRKVIITEDRWLKPQYFATKPLTRPKCIIQHPTSKNRKTEAAIGVAILNKFTAFGMPDIVKIG